jgi:tRNA A-37 threonylcarbamoyl transferase component Bud32
MTPLSGPDDDLEELVLDCLQAPDPRAELERRTAGRSELRALALRALEQTQRLEAAGAASAPSIPDVVIDGLIARGGQAAVFRGRQQYLERPVAVKVLDEQRDPAFVKRFRLEARTLASLSHPHIVACYQAGVTADGKCYLVMELIDGPTLRHWLNEHGPLPATTALLVTRQLAEALAAAQAAGIVHRDVKPENVLLKPRATAPGEVLPFVAKLADLGLARLHGTGPAGTLLTRAGMLLGTPETMAPEQIDDPTACDHRADIYGLGCVLFHMLAGRPAFAGTVSQILAAKAVHAHPELPALPDVSERVTALLRDMLARDPALRPSGYAQLIERLEELQPGPPKSRGPMLAVAAAVTVLVTTAVLLVRQFAPSQGSQEPPGRSAAPAFAGYGPLFLQDNHPLAAGWQADAAHWIPDDWVPATVTGALLTCKEGGSEATHRLPAGSWELIGGIRPRPNGTEPPAWFTAAGVRIAFAEGHALALELQKIEDAKEPGEAIFRARLLHVRQSAGGNWGELHDYGREQATWGPSDPLVVRFAWHDHALECHFGGKELSVQAADLGGGEPCTLSLYVVKGNVSFTDFILSAR